MFQFLVEYVSRTYMSEETYICILVSLAFFLSKKDTKLRPYIITEDRCISLTLHRLGSSNTLGTLVDLYGIPKLSASIIA